MIPNAPAPPKLEMLLLASLYLATQFARTGCPRLSNKLLHQLAILASLPTSDTCPVIAESCRRMHELWRQIHHDAETAMTPDVSVVSSATKPSLH